VNDELDARRIEDILAEGRKAQRRAKEVRLARLGCRMWSTALALIVLCWIAAVWLHSGSLGATGAILLIPTVVGGAIHANWYDDGKEGS
jgi:hypothetical protein